MSKEHKLRVSLNTAVEGKFDPTRWPDYNPEHANDKELSEKQYKEAWRWYNGFFRETTTTAHGLALAIYKGYAFAPVYQRNWRKKENFLQSGHIAFDFDTADVRSSLDTLCEDFFYSQNGAFGYSTPSSTPAAPKSRMVYIFENPITGLERYENLYRAMLKLYYGRFLADPSTKDGARLFFGSKKCEVRGNWELLSDDDIDSTIEVWRELEAHEAELERKKRPPVQPVLVGTTTAQRIMAAKVRTMVEHLASAGEGQKHHAVNRVGYALGGHVAAGYLSREEAFNAVMDGVRRMQGVRSYESAEQAANDAIEKGMGEPIYLEIDVAPSLSEVL